MRARWRVRRRRHDGCTGPREEPGQPDVSGEYGTRIGPQRRRGTGRPRDDVTQPHQEIRPRGEYRRLVGAHAQPAGRREDGAEADGHRSGTHDVMFAAAGTIETRDGYDLS
ncbi:hypothetical protein GCM10009675_22120 [Prauserella alba]|uniref:Uncharacterized protein n=1 Tax=Prauserella alba TaxID=176898 RepID=A0ABP4G4T0_9PSEU